jgi:hypothetical protein
MSLALTEKQAREIEAFCQIASENGAVISLAELIRLASIDASEHELADAFDSDTYLRSKFQLESGYVLERSPQRASPRQAIEEEERRRERARENLARGGRFGGLLEGGATVVSVSGANSFLSAVEGDDIDFFCVTKTDGMWVFMLRALVLARLHRVANSDVPELCFSCVMDEEWATKEFRTRQDPIFARDALTAKVMGGKAAYRELLEGASWMSDYFPTFYRMKLAETGPGDERPSGHAGRGQGSVVLNMFVYRTLGSFLRMKSWALNRRFTKAGRHSAIFMTKIGKGHYIFESNRYRKLRRMYGELEKEQRV